MMRAINQGQAKGNPLGYAPIAGLLRKFAVPSIISMLVNAAYNITDQIFIGHVVGMLGNAATNVAFPIVTLTVAFSQLVGIGTASNFNICMGAREEERARHFIGTGLTVMSVTGILIMGIVILFKTPILLLCGATENVLPYSQLYLGITAMGIPFLLFSSAGSHLIRADGSPAYSMTCTVVGAVLNIILDWLFMFVFQWGIQGAAAATITGQIISFLLCLFYFTRFKTFPVKMEMLGLRLEYIVKIVKLGTSNFINQVIMMSAFSVGLAQGSQPILGFNMGARNYGRVKETYKKALTAALIISVAAFLMFQLFPRQIVSIFGSGDKLYFQFAERYMRIFMLMVCVFGVQPLTVNYFTGIGNVRQGILMSLSRQGFFLIPLLLLLPILFGIDGVLYAGPIADSLACALSLTMVFLNFRKLDQEQKKADQAQKSESFTDLR